MDGYDPDRGPDPQEWLALPEEERHALVSAAHPGAPPMHVSLHVVVESQVASGLPAAARETVERFVAQGVRRHQAVHAVAGVLTKHLAGIAHGFDPVAYATDLRALDAATWIAARIRQDLARE